jgi:hypothetical protein
MAVVRCFHVPTDTGIRTSATVLLGILLFVYRCDCEGQKEEIAGLSDSNMRLTPQKNKDVLGLPLKLPPTFNDRSI